MQSWVRGSNKIKKEKDNRKIHWRINIEIINRIMYVIATVTLIILMGMLSFITAYSHNDLVISIMSLLMLVLSVFLSVKKLNPYMAFAVMIFVTIYGIIGVTVVLRGKISPQMSEIVCRWISAGNDTVSADKLFLPYWLLTYEEMLSMMLDRSDSNAPNQAMLFSSEVLNQKKEHLKKCEHTEMEKVITLDSPVPYDLQALIVELSKLDVQMVPGQNGRDKQGPYYGKLTRFIQRLNAKIEDKRLNFMFSQDSSLLEYDYMNEICEKLMRPSDNSSGGVKIIDFSEVPSDVLPLIASLVARVIFAVQQWSEVHTPIAIFCDEAHLYIPASSESTMDTQSVGSFERIAKEGRKYGVGLVVISQRPSEVNRTVLSQCNNFVAMRLTNADDQAVIKRLLPDSLGDYSEMLPILDIGEAIVVGDASILPSRIKVDAPNLKPRSATVNFWDEWSKDTSINDIKNAVEALRKQSKS